jgi:hypothetical protein
MRLNEPAEFNERYAAAEFYLVLQVDCDAWHRAVISDA